uniref:Uncharacterized protein n=1 Tax=Tanacetum cinerariifolium TaxID=118510 RepID=A0A6L2J246_TANCI|nr:hypothetical protein [Tanacetum cinerariifolium]
MRIDAVITQSIHESIESTTTLIETRYEVRYEVWEYKVLEMIGYQEGANQRSSRGKDASIRGSRINEPTLVYSGKPRGSQRVMDRAVYRLAVPGSDSKAMTED